MKKNSINPLISIIVLTNPFRPSKLTIDCIRSIYKQNYQNIELIVVDNGSKIVELNKLRDFFKKQRDKFVNSILIENKKNYGYAKGNNIGILKSKGEIIGIFNNDIELEKGVIKKCVSLLKRNKNIGICCPKIVYFSKPEIIWYAGGIIDPRLKLVAKHRGAFEKDNGQYDEIIETDYCNGSCMFIKREALKKSGLFDSFYFLYYEETDLNLRIKKCGYKAYYVGLVKVLHKIKMTENKPFQIYFYTRNRIIFSFKHFNFINIILFWSSQIRTSFLEIAKYFPDFEKIKIFTKGLIDGVISGIKRKNNYNVLKLSN